MWEGLWGECSDTMWRRGWRVLSQAKHKLRAWGWPTALQKSRGGGWEAGRRGAAWQGGAQGRPHLLVDVDGLLVLLQLRCVAGHLQQTLVGRAERGRAGVSGGGARGPRQGRGQAGGRPGTCWTPRLCSSLRTARSGRWPGETRGGGEGLRRPSSPAGPALPRPRPPVWSQRTGRSSPPHHWPGWAPCCPPSQCPPAPSRRSQRWRCGAWPRW